MEPKCGNGTSEGSEGWAWRRLKCVNEPAIDSQSVQLPERSLTRGKQLHLEARARQTLLAPHLGAAPGRPPPGMSSCRMCVCMQSWQREQPCLIKLQAWPADGVRWCPARQPAKAAGSRATRSTPGSTSLLPCRWSDHHRMPGMATCSLAGGDWRPAAAAPLQDARSGRRRLANGGSTRRAPHCFKGAMLYVFGAPAACRSWGGCESAPN